MQNKLTLFTADYAASALISIVENFTGSTILAYKKNKDKGFRVHIAEHLKENRIHLEIRQLYSKEQYDNANGLLRALKQKKVKVSFVNCSEFRVDFDRLQTLSPPIYDWVSSMVVNDESVHFHFSDWEKLFAQWKLKKHIFSDTKQLVISTHWASEGYWIEPKSKEVNSLTDYVYTGEAVDALEDRVRKGIKEAGKFAPGLIL